MFLRNPQKEAEDKIGYFCGLLIGHLPAGRSDGIDLSMLDSRWPRANLFKCGLHLIVIEILWFNINEAPVSPFESLLERRRTCSQHVHRHHEFFVQGGELHPVHASRFPV